MSYPKSSENFCYYEFRPRGFDRTWMPANKYQKQLVDLLAYNAQVLREGMPNGSYIKITSGVRASSDYDRLIRAGYRPSPTSDHFCGHVVQIPDNTAKNRKKIKVYGKNFYLSSGAIDTVPVGMSVLDFFNMAVKKTINGECFFGQVIYELDPEKGAEWVHLSNDYEQVFGYKTSKLLNKDKFLKTTDGGITYQKIS